MDYYRLAPDVDAEDLLEPDLPEPAPPDEQQSVVVNGIAINGNSAVVSNEDEDSDDPNWFVSSRSADRMRSRIPDLHQSNRASTGNDDGIVQMRRKPRSGMIKNPSSGLFACLLVCLTQSPDRQMYFSFPSASSMNGLDGVRFWHLSNVCLSIPFPHPPRNCPCSTGLGS